MLYAFPMAIAINFGRIYRYVMKNNGSATLIDTILSYFKKILTKFIRFIFFSNIKRQNLYISDKNECFEQIA